VYANAITEERLGIAENDLRFRLEYHSPGEIDAFNQQLEAKYSAEYAAAQVAAAGTEDPAKSFQVSLQRALCGTTPRLSSEEVRFIQNERALVMIDCAYFLTRYYFIKTPQAIQRFTFLPGQRAYFNVIAELESRYSPIEMIICKARQHGISTATEGIILHRAVTHYGVNAVVASAQRQSTGKMAQMTFLGYDRLPWWVRPLSTRRVESDQGMLVFGSSESGISFQHGNQRYGIARGDTVKIYHLSEVASYSNAVDLIEASLFRCVHPHPDVFGALESTAEGDTGWWYDKYGQAKKDWKNNRSRLCPLFLPWFIGTDKYPTPTWARNHPVPTNWRPSQETRQMMAKAELYVRSAPVLGKVLGANWTLPRIQAYYWEIHFQEARATGTEKKFFQEMPTDDVDAFQGSYDNVFGREVIADVWTKRKTSYAVYGLVGQSIEARHEPDNDDVDLSERIVPVTYVNRKGPTYRWELWPLQWAEPFGELTDIRDDESHMGKLFVWEAPVPGYDYAIGVDTGGGTGGDSTCISVARRGRSPQEQDVQVAEWRSNLVGHVEAFAFVMPIAAYYARYMEETTNYREPYVAVEQVASVGDTVNVQMSNMGYARFHKMIRYDSVPKQMRRAKAHKRGWFTHGWSRPILTDGFVILVKNGWYVVNSPYTIREMSQWEVHFTAGDKEKFEHSEDFTDDGIFANAMAGFCPNDTKTQAERTTKQFTAQDKLPALDIAPFCGITLCPDGHGVEDATGLRGMMRR
jgi:hypothetical protein